MNTLTDSIPPTPSWFWRQTHEDNFIVFSDDHEEMRKYKSGATLSTEVMIPISFRSYLDMCWWCGSKGINPSKR